MPKTKITKPLNPNLEIELVYDDGTKDLSICYRVDDGDIGSRHDHITIPSMKRKEIYTLIRELTHLAEGLIITEK